MAGKKDIVEQALKLIAQHFNEDAVRAAAEPVYKSRERVTYITPDQFLQLARPLDNGPNAEKLEALRKSISSGEKLHQIPFLNFTHEGDIARITGHEGRHRALALKEAGAEQMPVIMRSDRIRWSEQADPNRFDYVKDWPSMLKSETGENTIPFPIERPTEADGGPIREGYGPGGIIDDVVKLAGKVISGEGDEAAQAGIRAYHGSPHDFDKFDMSKIGTGEGAQAYGHGLYFAENEGVAKGYGDRLAGGPMGQHIYDDLLKITGNHGIATDSSLIDTIKRGGDLRQNLIELSKRKARSANDYDRETASFYANLAADEDFMKAVNDKKYNHMYEVNIAADPNTFLDWDKPLSEQPEAVRKGLEAAGFSPPPGGELMTGAQVYSRAMQNDPGAWGSTKEYVRAAMNELGGIPGIKYLDAGSRGAGDGTRNYVVFDDKLISIIRKYGIAGASAMLGYNLMENLDANQARAATAADMDYQSQKQAKANGGPVREGYQTKGRVVGDVVEQALKLIAGTGEQAAPKLSQANLEDFIKTHFPDASPNYSASNTDKYGPSSSIYYYIPSENGNKTIRLSDHDLGAREGVDLRYGEDLDMAKYKILKNFGVLSDEDLLKMFPKQIENEKINQLNSWQQMFDEHVNWVNNTKKKSERQTLIDEYLKTHPKPTFNSGGSVREGYGPGGIIDDVVRLAGKVITGEGDNVTRLSDVKSVRARDALIKQLKSSINQVKSGYFQAGRQALIDRKSLDLHKSGMLPLQQGTIVTPPSTWDMPGDWRVSGYWYDEKDPRRFGYRLQNESGQTYDAAASDPRAGLRRDNPYTFGAGFKAYAGPNAAPPKPVVAPVETPSAPEPPEVLDAINKEYESLFGSEDPFKPKAHGGRIAKGPGGWLDDVVSMAGKLVAGEGEQAAKTGIRAYQGSPHDFVAERLVRFPDGRTEYLVGQPDVLPDVPQGAEVLQDFPLGRMRMDKIGTGEGAQAYGHGLYFAEAEPVAESYRYIDARSDPDKVQYQGKPVTWYYEKAFQNKDRLDRARATGPEMSLANAKAKFWEDMMVGKHPKQVLDESLSEDHGWPELVEYAKKIKLSDFSGAELPGHMYEVNIAADPNTFLDWDKPLSEQRAFLDRLGKSKSKYARELLAHPDLLSPTRNVYGTDIGPMTGQDAFKNLALSTTGKVTGGPKTTDLLNKVGIPGIKYLDAGSRGAGEGTRNYVVFDDKLISIIRKYGIAGASAMLGYNLMEQLDSKQALAATMADQDYKAGQLSSETDDIDDALRVAKDVGGGIGPVFMTDAKGISYDIKGNIIPPEVTGPNPARSEATPEQVGQRAAQDPATFDALMERYAVPDQDIARYEATKAEVAKQPYETQQMTHVGAPPMRDVKVDMPLFGGEQKITQAPYNVASGLSGMAQTAYDFKTAPLYMTPWTAPIGAGLDVAEGVATADPLQASLAALGAPGKYAKAAIIGGSNYFMSPAEAQAGPARWFSKAMEVARDIPMNKMTGEQALAMLRKGTSPEELRWMGAEDFLSGQKSVSKDDLVAFLEKNRVQPTEIVLGGSNKPTRLENIDIIDIPSEIRDRHPEVYSLSNRVEELRNELVKLRSMPDQSGLDYYDNFRAVSQEFSKTQADLVRVKDAIRKEYVESIGGLGRPTKYGPDSSYGETLTTPGGEGYKETLTTLGNKGVPRVVKQGNSWTLRDADNNPVMNSQGSPYWYYDKEDAERAAKSIYREGGKYKSSHWDDPDVLFHTRSQVLDVTPPGANRPYKAWNVDETQSDWGQDVRKYGMKDPKVNWAEKYREEAKKMTDEWVAQKAKAAFDAAPYAYDNDMEKASKWARKMANITGASRISQDLGRHQEYLDLYNAMNRESDAIAAGPFVGSTEGWTDRSIKDQLDKALDAESDYFTWTPGDVHADRYSLDKHIGALQYEPMSQTLYAYDKKGSLLMQETATPDKLPDYIGKEAAEKLLATKTDTLNRTHILGGLDLKVGGEGMRGYYDNVYPKRVQEVIRKATGEKPVIETIEVQTANGPRKQLGIRLTDEMREKARFSDFKKGGRVTGGTSYDSNPTVDTAIALTREY